MKPFFERFIRNFFMTIAMVAMFIVPVFFLALLAGGVGLGNGWMIAAGFFGTFGGIAFIATVLEF
jgi:hypothetical protein